jgi:hypothetical protein
MDKDKDRTTTTATRSELVPVHSLTFRHPITVDLPGRGAASGVSSARPSKQAHVRVYYDPRWRHHRIECYAPGEALDRGPREVVYVPAEWCTWRVAL